MTIVLMSVIKLDPGQHEDKMITRPIGIPYVEMKEMKCDGELEPAGLSVEGAEVFPCQRPAHISDCLRIMQCHAMTNRDLLVNERGDAGWPFSLSSPNIPHHDDFFPRFCNRGCSSPLC